MIKGNVNNQNLNIVDTCVRCKANIYEGEKYYDISGKMFCQKCTSLNTERSE